MVIKYTNVPYIITHHGVDSYYSRFIYDINEIGNQTNKIIEQTKKVNF